VDVVIAFHFLRRPIQANQSLPEKFPLAPTSSRWVPRFAEKFGTNLIVVVSLCITLFERGAFGKTSSVDLKIV
jgi:hypothetical protein